MSKIKLMIASTLCCMMLYVGFTTCEKVMMTKGEEFMRANVEALTRDEPGTILVQCRCHSDLNCYSGNSISFRPPCSYSTNGNNGDILDCRQNDIVCENLQ